MTVKLSDTKTEDAQGNARKYQDADLFIICVAINAPASLQTIKNWTESIRKVQKNKPILIVRTKTDLIDAPQ